jgi:lipopolysaccharide exporter
LVLAQLGEAVSGAVNVPSNPRSERGTHPYSSSASRIRGFGWQFIGRLSRVLIQLVALIGYSRVLDPSELGLFAMATVTVSIGQSWGALALLPALLQRSRFEATERASATVVGLGLGLAMFAIVAMASRPIAGALGDMSAHSLITATGIVFVSGALAPAQIATLLREGRVARWASIDTGSYAVGFVGLGLILAHNGLGVWSLIVGTVVSDIIRTALLLLLVPTARSSVRDFSRVVARQYLRFYARIGSRRSLDQLARNIDYIVVGRWFGVASLGVYTRGYQVVQAPINLLQGVVHQVGVSDFSSSMRDRGLEGLQRSLLALIEVFGALTLPLALIVAVSSNEIIAISIGPRWLGASPVLAILAIGMYFRSLDMAASTALIAAGKLSADLRLGLVYAGLVVLGSILGAAWGMTGVAAGVSVAMGLYATVALLTVATILSLPYRAVAKALAPGAIAALLAGIALLSSYRIVEGLASPFARLAAYLTTWGIGVAIGGLFAMVALEGFRQRVRIIARSVATSRSNP